MEVVDPTVSRGMHHSWVHVVKVAGVFVGDRHTDFVEEEVGFEVWNRLLGLRQGRLLLG